mmetsp:Transcript_888/g.1789  ORF Transcript_888/g.1789 Transcript_888/m.1789 type:complete len:137 (+) Transcript_888:132-542(+)
MAPCSLFAVDAAVAKVAALVLGLVVLVAADYEMSAAAEELPPSPGYDVICNEVLNIMLVVLVAGVVMAVDWEASGFASIQNMITKQVKDLGKSSKKNQPCTRWNMRSCRATSERCKFGHFCSKCGDASHGAAQCSS